MSQGAELLQVEDLHVEFDTYGGVVKAVRGVDFSVAAGETLAYLNCLIGRKMATFEEDEQGVYWYQQVPEARQFD